MGPAHTALRTQFMGRMRFTPCQTFPTPKLSIVSLSPDSDSVCNPVSLSPLCFLSFPFFSLAPVSPLVLPSAPSSTPSRREKAKLAEEKARKEGDDTGDKGRDEAMEELLRKVDSDFMAMIKNPDEEEIKSGAASK